MSRPSPRRHASSRTPTSRPRRLAGQAKPSTSDGAELPGHPAVDELSTAERGAPVDRVPPATVGRQRPAAAVEEPPAAGDQPPPSTRSRLAGEGVTKALIVVLAVLAVVLLLQFGWWVRHQLRDDPADEQVRAEDDAIAVPADQPIMPEELVVQEGVEAAAKAAQTIVAVNYEDYDREVDEAAALMTEDFAGEYRQTTADIREEFVARKTVIEARVVAQGVVRANDTELDALVFLNQYVVRGEGENARTVYTPYRALLTMVHTDEGWLVDNLDTK